MNRETKDTAVFASVLFLYCALLCSLFAAIHPDLLR